MPVLASISAWDRGYASINGPVRAREINGALISFAHIDHNSRHQLNSETPPLHSDCLRMCEIIGCFYPAKCLLFYENILTKYSFELMSTDIRMMSFNLLSNSPMRGTVDQSDRGRITSSRYSITVILFVTYMHSLHSPCNYSDHAHL